MQRYSEAAGTEGSVIEATDGEYILYEDHVEAMKRIAGDGGQQVEPDDDDYDSEATNSSVAVPWDKFPGWLIDHHEGEAITEEGLQHALAAMLKVHPPIAAPAPSASPEKP